MKRFRPFRVFAASASYAAGLLLLAHGLRAIWHYQEYVAQGWDAHRASEWLRTGLLEIGVAAFLIVLGTGFMASRFRWFRSKSWVNPDAAASL